MQPWFFAWAVCKWLDESVEGNHQVICTLIFMDHIKATSRCIRRHFVGASYARFRHKPLKSVWMQNGGCCPVPLPPPSAAGPVAAPHTRAAAAGRRPSRTPDDEAASVFCKLFDHVQDIPNSWDSTSLARATYIIVTFYDFRVARSGYRGVCQSSMHGFSYLRPQICRPVMYAPIASLLT